MRVAMIGLRGIPHRREGRRLGGFNLTVNVTAEEEGEHQVLVRGIDPDGQEFLPSLQAPLHAANADFLDGVTLNFMLTLNETRFVKPGRHRFDLFVVGITVP